MRLTLRTSGQGNVWVRLWVVAPDGTAAMFDENAAPLAQQDPRSDAPTQGDRSPYLDRYLAANNTVGDVPPRLSRHG